MKVFFVLLSIIGAVLFGACSNEQKFGNKEQSELRTHLQYWMPI